MQKLQNVDAKSVIFAIIHPAGMNNRNNCGFCTEILQNFAFFLDFSAKLDIFEHICEIPDFFHLKFEEKYLFLYKI